MDQTTNNESNKLTSSKDKQLDINKEYKSVKNKKKIFKLILEKHNVDIDKQELIINDFMSDLFPPRTRRCNNMKYKVK